MNIVKRDKYSFIGPKAEDAAKYYDTVISHGYNGDMIYLAWDAAHKFGMRMTSDKLASFRDGVAIGEGAILAAEFIDKEYKRIYQRSEKVGRSQKMKMLMVEVYKTVEKKYGVEVRLL